MTEPALLTMQGVEKAFGANKALRNVSLELFAGEVHALVGENGAGKSTLMKVLSGACRPDAGKMTLAGHSYAPSSPRAARASGVAMIYQELALAEHLSVQANIVLGAELSRFGLLNRRAERRATLEALEILERSDIDPARRVSELGPASRQVVEIARALASRARVIVFDEPTSSLTERDSELLFATIKRLRDQGLGIIYISHFLEEVRRAADRYTVLRDGEVAAAGSIATTSLETIVQAMIGRPPGELFPRFPRERGELLLRVNGVSGSVLPRDASLELFRGEVLGIAGLVGAGRTELLRLIFGLDAVKSGTVKVAAAETMKPSPESSIALGLGMVSEDRKLEGLALARSIEDNMTYSALARHSRFGVLDLVGRSLEAGRLCAKLKIRCPGTHSPVGSLSGGNQQKVALARLFHQNAHVFLLDEPTRGIDVGAKSEIYRMIGESAAAGAGVLLVSSYLPELFGICDRIAVMTRGRLHPALPVSEWTEHAVIAQAAGA